MNNKNSFNYNWVKNGGNITLNILDENGISMYLGKKGDINFKLSNNQKYESIKDYKALENILKNIIGINFDLSDFKERKKSTDEDYSEKKLNISPEDLKLVTDEIFDPFSKEEFILQDKNTYKLNKFKPTSYMELNNKIEQMDMLNFDSSVIYRLIIHLVNYDKQRANWVINWLAYFFQGLEKSQVALVLLGEQGAGKGILFNEIIKPLFGEDFVKTINDKSLNTNYKGSLVEDTLFFNLDEISANKSSSSSIKNFLKALVTNKTITVEKKFKNLDKETPIYGQTLITSNELYAIEIELRDRRFTVFSTGGNLSYCNFLGYERYEALLVAIKSDLESFAVYLKNYQVDVQEANIALNTYEKDDLINQYQISQYPQTVVKLTKLQKNIIEFAEAIRFRNCNFFRMIVDENKFKLKNEILFDLQCNIFRVENLLPTFKTLYGSRSFGTSSELLRELQKVDLNLFSNQNIQEYIIEDEQKECFTIPPFCFHRAYNV